jgi:hypothetical protein
VSCAIAPDFRQNRRRPAPVPATPFQANRAGRVARETAALIGTVGPRHMVCHRWCNRGHLIWRERRAHRLRFLRAERRLQLKPARCQCSDGTPAAPSPCTVLSQEMVWLRPSDLAASLPPGIDRTMQRRTFRSPRRRARRVWSAHSHDRRAASIQRPTKGRWWMWPSSPTSGRRDAASGRRRWHPRRPG